MARRCIGYTVKPIQYSLILFRDRIIQLREENCSESFKIVPTCFSIYLKVAGSSLNSVAKLVG